MDNSQVDDWNIRIKNTLIAIHELEQDLDAIKTDAREAGYIYDGDKFIEKPPVQKIISRDSKWYYIPEISITDMIHGGWLAINENQDTDNWLPFSFWEVKAKNETEDATQDEIERYKQAFESVRR